MNKIREFDDKRLKIITHKNIGFVDSIIEGVKNASGDLIAIHGSGDYSNPKRIERQVEYLNKNKSIGIVGCYVKNKDTLTGKEYVHKPTIPEDNLVSYIKKNNPFTHGEVMYRKEIYYKAGGYRSFFKYAQDRDLWMRMALHTNFGVVPEVLYTRYNLAGGVSKSPEKVIMQKYFNEISRQCLDLKISDKDDLIEKHGHYAPFFLNRSKQLSNTIYKVALKEYLNKDLLNAKTFNELSLKESKLISNLILKIIIAISYRSENVNNIIRKAILKLKFLVKKTSK